MLMMRRLAAAIPVRLCTLPLGVRSSQCEIDCGCTLRMRAGCCFLTTYSERSSEASAAVVDALPVFLAVAFTSPLFPVLWIRM